MIKEKILEVLKDNNPISKDKLVRLFSIDKGDKKDFIKVIEKLVKENKIILINNLYFVEDGEKYICGEIQSTNKGYGFLRADDGDIFISKKDLQGAFNKDIVFVQIKDETNGASREGKVLKVLKRFTDEFVGTYYNQGLKYGFVELDIAKANYDIYIPKKYKFGAKNGQKVVVKIDKWAYKDKNPEGRIIEILGYGTEKGVSVLSVAKSLNIPIEFPKSVLREAKNIPLEVLDKDISSRVDLRDEMIFTIDGEDSKDFDDAVSIKKLGENFELSVHIADVSHYVKKDSQLDIEAYKRGNSVYLIDKVIPMLPESLSNGICSLNPKVDRLTLSVKMVVNNKGKVIEHNIFESVINSKRRLIYDDVSDFLEHGEKTKDIDGIEEDLKMMEELANILMKKRYDRGSIEFDFPESKIELDENGHPINFEKAERRIANKIIEEFMILCNETVSEEYFWREIPFVYRVHEEPEVERISSLNKMIRPFNLKLNTQNFNSKSIQKLIEEVKGKEVEKLVSTLVLRSLSKAEYRSENELHFGLASKNYSHFTSPIRRYADLVIHRIIKKVLSNDFNNEDINYYERELQDITKHISTTERIAQEGERQIEDIKASEYMSDRIGEEYDGTIFSITSFGMFIGLDNTIEGLVSYNSMDEYCEFIEDELIAIARESNKVYKIGDKVRIKVVNTNITRGEIDFELIGD